MAIDDLKSIAALYHHYQDANKSIEHIKHYMMRLAALINAMKVLDCFEDKLTGDEKVYIALLDENINQFLKNLPLLPDNKGEFSLENNIG